MATKTKDLTAAEVQTEERTPVETPVAEPTGAPVDKQAQEAKERAAAEQLKAFLDKLPDPFVYCGPSVRGVARQFTVYNGGIPDALREFVMEHRAAKGLLVSVERFALVRKRLETPGTGEYILFNKVRAEM